MLSLLRLECKQKIIQTHFEFAYFSFLLTSFGVETINTFIRSRSFLENQNRFQTKMGKVCTRFQTKTAQKPYQTEMGRLFGKFFYQTSPPYKLIYL